MITRRSILQLVPALGISSTVFARSLAQEAVGQDELTAEMIASAKWISGIELNEQQEAALVRQVNGLQAQLKSLRSYPLDPQDDLPAMQFSTLPGERVAVGDGSIRRGYWPVSNETTVRPSDDELAFLPVSKLSNLIRTRQISSRQLTEFYLERLKKYDPLLMCVVNLTEERALRQADRLDREIAQGRYRGPLHGIPWGAKDLLCVPDYPTTWGIPVFQNRVINQTATVVDRLDQAGAVLVGKLSLGAIAMGDRWYRGMTRNPWNPRVGSSGSSAGSASATAAGLVGFAIGSETLGSILSPSTRCGCHGLRPTFGRISRFGAMPLSWSMDKLGPMGRNVDDLATVFAAIYGPDRRDPTVQQREFDWPLQRPLDFSKMRIGVLDPDQNDEGLQIIRDLGCEIKQVTLPQQFPLRSLTRIIDIEGAAIFDDLLKAGETDGWNSWTQTFQAAQFITAIDYLKMQRVRQKLMQAFELAIADIDILWNARDLLHTNLTGHPSVIMPFRFVEQRNRLTPQMVTITGHLYDEATVLAFAKAIESRRPEPLPNPPLDSFLLDRNQNDEST